VEERSATQMGTDLLRLPPLLRSFLLPLFILLCISFPHSPRVSQRPEDRDVQQDMSVASQGGRPADHVGAMVTWKFGEMMDMKHVEIHPHTMDYP
jgi:hypothetical protein